MSSTESRIGLAKSVHRAVFVPGDGIGPEVAWAARRVVEATGAEISWEEVQIGHELFVETGRAVPDRALKVLRRIPVVFKGPVEGAGSGITRNPNLEVSEALNVFASVRRCRFLEGTPSPWHGFDAVIIRRECSRSPHAHDSKARENAEAVPGGRLAHGAADIRIVTRHDLYRFADFGFAQALRMGRKRICVAHKMNTIKNTEKMFLEVAEEVSERYPQVEMEDQLAGHVALQLARAPGRFDVILVNDLYGEILADLAVGLSGGLGLAPEVQYGTRGVVFGTVHGTSPKYAGMDCANPCGMIFAACEMLDYMGEKRAATTIENAVRGVLVQGLYTRDLAGGDRAGLTGARSFTDAVIGNIRGGSLWGRKAPASENRGG